MPSLLENPTWRAYLSPFAAELVPHVEVISRDITAVLHQRVPEIGENPALAAATGPSAEANIALVLTMIRDGIPVDALQPPPAAVAQARDYAITGGEIAWLHRTYRIGHELFLTQFVGQLQERITDPRELSAATALATEFTFHYVDAISTSVLEIFTAERERWVRSSAALRSDTVRAILSGATSDAATASRRLGYDLERPHVAFLVWADPTEQDVFGLLEERASRLASALGARSSLLVPLGRLTIAGWISSRATPELASADVDLGHAEFGIRAAVGMVEHGLAGFRLSHLQATEARRIVEQGAPPAGRVELYERIALVALTTQEPQLASSFVAHELGALADGTPGSERLAETLAAYLATGSSPARTARRLGIHENTVANRIAKVEATLGHPVDRRRLELALALQMRAAVRASG